MTLGSQSTSSVHSQCEVAVARRSRGADVHDQVEVVELEALRHVGVAQLGPMSGSSFIIAKIRSITVAELLRRLEAHVHRPLVFDATHIRSLFPGGRAASLRLSSPPVPATAPPPPDRGRCAERVLLPGDPGRALLLAQALLDEPKMFNHNRGLWGYTGSARRRRAADDPEHRHGRAERGDRRSRSWRRSALERRVRVGTCGALDAGSRSATLVVATEAIAADGDEPRARRGRARRRPTRR